MKILHCCLAAFYIDNYSYQENILPRHHQLLGHQVKILASCETYFNNRDLGYTDSKTYYNEDNIQVTRIPYVSWAPSFIVKKLRLYKGIYQYLESFQPDIIFIHDCQFISIYSIAKYANNHKVRIYIDTHTDFINSGRSWVSKVILHKIIYKLCCRIIDKYTYKYFGTLPLRIDFLKDVYGVKESKIELLPFGVDDSLFKNSDKNTIRIQQRRKMGFSDNDFVIISGGKIDSRKNIHLLVEAYLKIKPKLVHSNLRLLVFGKPAKNLEDFIFNITSSEGIKYIEWLAANEIYKYFLAADIAFFPGTHSVLWEEAVGLGIPCIFKYWDGISHVDLGGNCIFLNDVTIETIAEVLQYIVNTPSKFHEMKEIANSKGPQNFSYSSIAKKSLL